MPALLDREDPDQRGLLERTTEVFLNLLTAQDAMRPRPEWPSRTVECPVPHVIKITGFANGVPCPHAGQYLKSFDFEYDHGTGFGQFTPDPRFAMKFADAGAAAEFWRTQSRTRPLRSGDGRANRPLTASSVEILPLWKAEQC